MIGRTLAHYEILEALGRGGMGEVYRARDTKLGRDVAIKVLPEILAADPERSARFEREARTLASLNHPNVAQIYGLEEADGVRFLAMEYVEGQDLQKRLKDGGALEPDEATAIAVQIAAGLEAAHEQGIVHRDLKPANVMVTGDGQVKVLDFGLARAFAGEPTEEDPALSPTITGAMTQAGTVLGTAAYMSPEQARGKTVDRRADIWAFGVILMEMLTGRSMFGGETISDTLAAVLKESIDFDTLDDDVPDPLRYVLERCLDRNPSRRLRDIGEARLVLSGEATSLGVPAVTGPVEVPKRARAREIVAWAVAAVSVAAAVFFATRDGGTVVDQSAAAPSIRASVSLPRELQVSSNSSSSVVISPDGRSIVVAAENVSDGRGVSFYRRAIDGTHFVRIEGTEEAEDPAFSFDGQHLTFTRHSYRHYRIPASGGAPTLLGRSDAFGAAWTEDDSLIYCESYAGGLRIRSVQGGTSRALTSPDDEDGVLGHWHPEIVPGTPWVLFTSYRSPGDSSRTYAYHRETGERRPVVEGARYARWAESGHVLFVRQNQLIALPVDRHTMRARGTAVPILPDMSMDATDGYSHFSIGRDGTFIYIPREESAERSQVAIIRHDGTVERLHDDPRPFLTPRLSPDGRTLAVSIGSEDRDIWSLDLERRAWTRLTFHPTSEFGPVWSPDGEWIYFARESPAFNVYRLRPRGSSAAELVLPSTLDHMPLEVFDDGSFLVLQGSVERAHDILLFADGEATPIRAERFLDTEGSVSPDGSWLAYTSNETGARQVYVQRYPRGEGRIPISIDGGEEPRWSPDGSSLYFRDAASLLRVDVEVVDGTLRASRPETLWTHPFEDNWYTSNYDVLPDDSGIVAIVPVTDRGRREITIITNFFDELERRAPASGSSAPSSR